MKSTILIQKSTHILLFAPLAFAAACNTSVNTVQTPSRGGANRIPVEKILFNPELSADLRVDDVREKMSGDHWTIQVNLTNVTGGDIEYQYRFEWLDPQGFLVDTPTSTWLPRKAHAGETLEITGVAPKPNIADFRLKLTNLDR
ncbi:MAG: YcfL family protein [Planctomycetes bacterium]|nr:YcfL family protein [Planctomycetota bacterium]